MGYIRIYTSLARSFQVPSVNVNLDHQNLYYTFFSSEQVSTGNKTESHGAYRRWCVYTHRFSWMGGTASGHHKSALGVSLNHLGCA